MMNTRPDRLIVAISAAFAMTVLVGAGCAFSQDTGGSAAGAGPALDVDTAVDGQSIIVPSPGAPAYLPMSSPLTQAARPPLNPGPSIISPADVPMSSPVTQAASPPLNPGQWMISPSRPAFSQPAGSPVTGMAKLHPSSGSHH